MSCFHFRPDWAMPESLATPERLFLDRRRVIAGLGLGGLSLALGGRLAAQPEAPEDVPGLDLERLTRPAVGDRFADRFPARRNEAYDVAPRTSTPERVASRYNNFYEFTLDKVRVWDLAHGYPVDPWTVRVDGLVRKKRALGLEDLYTRFALEERLYRFRCVERWAMQVPWTGFPLRALIDFLEPMPSARYVRFISFRDRAGLPGQQSQPWYPWPYFEGLRLDEARHPLAFVVVGSYGHALPMQHGGPWRLALPWKYGYKSPKSIVAVEFTKRRPGTFWSQTTPAEYGFYSNVDPDKPHPRWSQARERDIGTGEERATLRYNGYAEQVAGLYRGDEF